MTATKRTVGKGLILGFEKPEDLEPVANAIEEFFQECAAGGGMPVVHPSTRDGQGSLELSCVAPQAEIVGEEKEQGPLRAPERKTEL